MTFSIRVQEDFNAEIAKARSSAENLELVIRFNELCGSPRLGVLCV